MSQLQISCCIVYLFYSSVLTTQTIKVQTIKVQTIKARLFNALYKCCGSSVSFSVSEELRQKLETCNTMVTMCLEMHPSH